MSWISDWVWECSCPHGYIIFLFFFNIYIFCSFLHILLYLHYLQLFLGSLLYTTDCLHQLHTFFFLSLCLHLISNFLVSLLHIVSLSGKILASYKVVLLLLCNMYDFLFQVCLSISQLAFETTMKICLASVHIKILQWAWLAGRRICSRNFA